MGANPNPNASLGLVRRVGGALARASLLAAARSYARSRRQGDGDGESSRGGRGAARDTAEIQPRYSRGGRGAAHPSGRGRRRGEPLVRGPASSAAASGQGPRVAPSARALPHPAGDCSRLRPQGFLPGKTTIGPVSLCWEACGRPAQAAPHSPTETSDSGRVPSQVARFPSFCVSSKAVRSDWKEGRQAKARTITLLRDAIARRGS